MKKAASLPTRKGWPFVNWCREAHSRRIGSHFRRWGHQKARVSGYSLRYSLRSADDAGMRVRGRGRRTETAGGCSMPATFGCFTVWWWGYRTEIGKKGTYLLIYFLHTVYSIGQFFFSSIIWWRNWQQKFLDYFLILLGKTIPNLSLVGSQKKFISIISIYLSGPSFEKLKYHLCVLCSIHRGKHLQNAVTSGSIVLF